jgi:hypothetical protein
MITKIEISNAKTNLNFLDTTSISSSMVALPEVPAIAK